MTKRTRKSIGGSTPAEKASLGRSLSVRPGRSPGMEASTGTTLAVRPGKSPGEDASKGNALAVHELKKGGPAHKKVYKQLHGVYEVLHKHFGGEMHRKPKELAKTLKGFHRPRGR